MISWQHPKSVSVIFGRLHNGNSALQGNSHLVQGAAAVSSVQRCILVAISYQWDVAVVMPVALLSVVVQPRQ